MSIAYRFALFAGGLHLVAFLIFAAIMASNALAPGAAGAQWQFGWMIFVLIDLPISLIMYWDGWPDGDFNWLPYPLNSVRSFIIPCVIFGILGTVWYALLGGLVGLLVERFMRFAERGKKQKTT